MDAMSPYEVVLSLLSLSSLGCGIFFSIRGATREKSKDDKNDATQMSLVMFKLDNIGNAVNEIKSDSKVFRKDIQDTREKILLLEQEQKSVNEKITIIEKSIDKEVI